MKNVDIFYIIRNQISMTRSRNSYVYVYYDTSIFYNTLLNRSHILNNNFLMKKTFTLVIAACGRATFEKVRNPHLMMNRKNNSINITLPFIEKNIDFAIFFSFSILKMWTWKFADLQIIVFLWTNAHEKKTETIYLHVNTRRLNHAYVLKNSKGTKIETMRGESHVSGMYYYKMSDVMIVKHKFFSYFIYMIFIIVGIRNRGIVWWWRVIKKSYTYHTLFLIKFFIEFWTGNYCYGIMYNIKTGIFDLIRQF